MDKVPTGSKAIYPLRRLFEFFTELEKILKSIWNKKIPE